MFQNRPGPLASWTSQRRGATCKVLYIYIYPQTSLSVERVRCPLSLPTSQLVNRSTSQLIKPGCWIEASRLQVIYIRGRTRPPQAATAMHSPPQNVRHPGPGLHVNQKKINEHQCKSMKPKDNRRKLIRTKEHQ